MDSAWRSRAAAMVEFARAAQHPLGFGWLDERGVVDQTRPVELWITCRMTHVFALESLRSLVDSAPRQRGPSRAESSRGLAAYGVAALLGAFRDREYDGWFGALAPGNVALGGNATDKTAYGHAFVILAGATATGAGIPRGPELLAAALDVFDQRFWREADGLAVDTWDRNWARLEPYRGANANMHAVEALLAAYDVSGDRRRLDQALHITERLIHQGAARAEYRLCEHFGTDWSALPDYNRADPAHAFRPYGVTIGHLAEWARLCLHVREALGPAAPDWLLSDARGLFDRAVQDGWAVDGNPGFVYTADFEGTPVVRHRMHWVLAEALGAAWALWTATGDQQYAEWHRGWWSYAERHFLDGGSWRHELDPENRPASTVWTGRPDTYHAYQATILPSLPPAASYVGALCSRVRSAQGPAQH